MRTAILAAALTGLCAVAGRSAPPQPPKVEGGKVIFQTSCAACHGTDARGGGPVAESLKTKPPDLRRIAQRRGGTFPEGEVVGFIDGRTRTPAHGTREMPVWGDRLARAVKDEKEREARVARNVEMLVAYLKTIQE